MWGLAAFTAPDSGLSDLLESTAAPGTPARPPRGFL